MPDDYYSNIAPVYEELHGAEQDEKLRDFLERVVLLPGQTLLDVGCGTGRSVLFLRQVRWQGLEPSPGLILHAQKNAYKKITKGSAEKIPFPPYMFDIILSLTALQNFTDPKKGLEEMKRVCKQEGILMISFLKKSSRKDKLDALIKELFTVKESWEQAKDMMYICSK